MITKTITSKVTVLRLTFISKQAAIAAAAECRRLGMVCHRRGAVVEVEL